MADDPSDRLVAEVEGRIAQQACVATLSQRALSGADVEDLLVDLVSDVARILSADLVGFLASTDDPAVFTATAGFGWPDAFVHDGRPMPVTEGGPTAWVLHHDEPMVTGDIVNDERFAPAPILVDCGVSSSIVVRIGDPALGIFGVHSRKPHFFSRADADFVAAAAAVVAAARERHRAEAVVRRLALYDGLTGLPNRSLFVDRLEQALRERERTGRDVGLLVLDLDRFKQVNDTLGHHVGDLLLHAVGERLAAGQRAADTVARLGGDEFAVLLTGLTDGPTQAAAIAAKIATRLSRPFEIEGTVIPGGTSIGIATAPLHGERRLELFRRADAAMYRAKRTRTGWAVWDPVRDAAEDPVPTLVADLERAVVSGELALVYQPIFGLPEQMVIGAEALVRWRHPERGVLAPGLFLAAAEHTGLVVEVSHWVCETAFADAAGWGAGKRIAVNGSPRWIGTAGMATGVCKAWQASGLDPADVVVEIGERMLAAADSNVMSGLEELAAFGAVVAIDDVGAGFATLGHLAELAATGAKEAKLDPGLVAYADRGPAGRAVLRSVVSLAHDLGMRVTAEGVESEGTVETLVAVGCDAVQGFALSPPLNPETARDLFRSLPAP